MQRHMTQEDKPKIFIALILLAGTFYLLALTRNTWHSYWYIGRSSETPHTISIAGKGEVLVIPDIATISLGLQTENISVSVAQKQNTEKMNKVHEVLQKLGTAKEDIETTNYSVYPAYDWTNNRQVLRAYVVTQSVNVKIRDFEKIPDVLQLIGTLNLNQVGGLNFSVDKPDDYEARARILAIRDAQKKAEALAKEAGVKLGKIISFSENTAPSYPVPMYKSYDMGAVAENASATPQVEAGSQKIIMNISIAYEIL